MADAAASAVEPRVASTAQRLVAEALGAFFVTATAIGVDVFYYSQGNIDYASRWLARGLITAAVIYAFADTSGAHVNPAVTLGFLLRRVFPLPMASAYIAAQLTGAFVAAAMWRLVVDGPTFALGASHPGLHVAAATAAVAELVLTFTLMLVILMTAQDDASVGKQAAVAVGFTVAACGFVAGPLSGASMNPARTIAPQILSGQFEHIWIYVAGPAAGAAVAVAVHFLLCGGPSEGERRAARGKHPAPARRRS
jgi:aquaporin Z